MLALGWIAVGVIAGAGMFLSFGWWPTFVFGVIYGIATYYVIGDE